MSSTVPVAGPERTVSPDSKILLLAVQAVLDSPIFQRAHRLSQLLTYMTERTAERDLESLKECAIGHRVFNRPAGYNPAEDNIVRSNVHQLRLKLKEYYATTGEADPWRVAVPKGSYVLVVDRRLADAAASEPRVVDSASHPAAGRMWSLRGIAISLSMALFAAVLVLAAYLGGKPVRASKAPARCLLELLAPDPGQRLTVVVPDANLQLYQRLTGRTVSLQDYVEHRFVEPEAFRQVSPGLAGSANTLFESSITQSFVLDVIPRFAQVVPANTLSVRNPDTLSMKDFERDNAVLISGPYGNPWVQLFDRNLNFQIEAYKRTWARIVDRNPQGPEKKEYYNFVDSSNTTVCYARVAYLPGLTAGTHVVLAGGPHVASTEAASLFLTRDESLSAVRKLFRLTSAQPLPHFELLVEARALGNAPWEMKIVAGRTVAAR